MGDDRGLIDGERRGPVLAQLANGTMRAKIADLSAVISEIGVAVKEFFPGDAHLASWAGLCPGNHQSAGKRRSGKPRPGNTHLQTLLVKCARKALLRAGRRLLRQHPERETRRLIARAPGPSGRQKARRRARALPSR